MADDQLYFLQGNICPQSCARRIVYIDDDAVRVRDHVKGWVAAPVPQGQSNVAGRIIDYNTLCISRVGEPKGGNKAKAKYLSVLGVHLVRVWHSHQRVAGLMGAAPFSHFKCITA